MNSDDYVLDEKRGKAWVTTYDALVWYRAELDRIERQNAEFAAWLDIKIADCKNGGGMSMAEAIQGAAWLDEVKERLLRNGIAPDRVAHHGEGCGAPLADGSWWRFCGERDIDSLPALCVNCGGQYKLA